MTPANFLGLGWAATPAGLRAMERLSELNRENCKEYGGLPSVVNNEMCTLLIINISSLQLTQVNIIAYRSQYGSVNPTAIVFCKTMDSRKRRASVLSVFYTIIKTHNRERNILFRI